MALYDLPLEQLERFAPSPHDVGEQLDFDEFWRTTLRESRAAATTAVTRELVVSHLTLVDVYDVTFPGFDGQPIRAWFTVPRGAVGPLATVVEFNGYGGGRGLAQDHLLWAAAGYAHLFMDTRGQGSTWGHGGDTPDPAGSGPAFPGLMTRGIASPHEHYLRRLITDAVRAVDAVGTFDEVDPARIAVAGTSQGGGLALAVSGLADGVAAVMSDVPFLSHFRRAVDLVDTMPYGEISGYLATHRGQEDTVLGTLSYFDAVSHARRATAPLLCSVALRDPVCPPSTVFGAFNVYGRQDSAGARDKEMVVYPFNQHEGGQGFQAARRLEWLGSRV